MMHNVERKKLWAYSEINSPNAFDQSHESGREESYESILRKYSTSPLPKSYFQLVANALVVVQETALTSYLGARYRLELLSVSVVTDSHGAATNLTAADPSPRSENITYSNFCMLSGLAVAIYYSMRSDPSQQQPRKDKARQRMLDSLLLAVLLRFGASVLRSCTASYSSDTVHVLTGTGFLLHVLACDYTYANGWSSPLLSSAASLGTGDHNLPTQLRRLERPPFAGGTLALNAALFATTLSVSRLSSDLVAYLYLCLSIVLFVFFGTTRHAIAASYPTDKSGALWLITGWIIAATAMLLLDDRHLLFALFAVLLFLGVLTPTWKYFLQQHKMFLRGPWDIPTASSMQLDIPTYPSLNFT